MTQDQFFKHYCAADNEDAIMLKLKDFPPDDNFSERLGRHNEVCHFLRGVTCCWLRICQWYMGHLVPYLCSS